MTFEKGGCCRRHGFISNACYCYGQILYEQLVCQTNRLTRFIQHARLPGRQAGENYPTHRVTKARKGFYVRRRALSDGDCHADNGTGISGSR
jgi:hypothetical protein